MRTGICITLKPGDRRRLAALAWDRNAAHKHVWRAEIVLLSADGVGTHEIMRRTGKSKTCVWRWQERFMQAGYDGLLRDKTRPSRIPPLGSDIAERVIALTRTDPPVEATHWTASMMAKAVNCSLRGGLSLCAPREGGQETQSTTEGGPLRRQILFGLVAREIPSHLRQPSLDPKHRDKRLSSPPASTVIGFPQRSSGEEKGRKERNAARCCAGA